MDVSHENEPASSRTGSPQLANMVERVARAMFAHDQLSDEAKLDEWDAHWRGSRSLYLELAQVAIAAMREPTEAMLLAVGESVQRFDPETIVDYSVTASFWAKMIDTALAEDSGRAILQAEGR